RHAVEYEERRHSQLFCRHSARDVLNMLLDECAAAGVEIRTHCELLQVSALDSQHLRYRLELRQGQQPLRIECHSLVVASGALSIRAADRTSYGYRIAGQVGRSVARRPAGGGPFMLSVSMKALCGSMSGLAP